MMKMIVLLFVLVFLGVPAFILWAVCRYVKKHPFGDL